MALMRKQPLKLHVPNVCQERIAARLEQTPPVHVSAVAQACIVPCWEQKLPLLVPTVWQELIAPLWEQLYVKHVQPARGVLKDQTLLPHVQQEHILAQRGQLLPPSVYHVQPESIAPRWEQLLLLHVSRAHSERTVSQDQSLLPYVRQEHLETCKVGPFPLSVTRVVRERIARQKETKTASIVLLARIAPQRDKPLVPTVP
jgi:hypothetical protein